MPQIVAHDRQLNTVREGESRMRMPHPMRACPAQLVGEQRMVICNQIRGLQEEPAQQAEGAQDLLHQVTAMPHRPEGLGMASMACSGNVSRSVLRRSLRVREGTACGVSWWSRVGGSENQHSRAWGRSNGWNHLTGWISVFRCRPLWSGRSPALSRPAGPPGRQRFSRPPVV